jgi:ABC-type Fe3+ transport system permease subunit
MTDWLAPGDVTALFTSLRLALITSLLLLLLCTPLAWWLATSRARAGHCSKRWWRCRWYCRRRCWGSTC